MASGAAADGAALVTIDLDGTAVQAPYLASYSPAVGHVVLVSMTGTQPLIHARIVGTPPA